jgi:hypothetical protein
VTFAVRDLRDLREQLAQVSGDVDRYIAVPAEHVDSAVQYERIVRVLPGSQPSTCSVLP